jgi:predicted DNA-binding transcriptional regulator YafY
MIEAKPYKILFMNENFYIAAETIDQPYPFSLYRISKVSDFKERDKTFHKHPEISDFIADIQTPFSKYQPEYARFMIDVLLEVDAKKAYFFKSKNFLKSQNIIEEKENGDLIVSYRITQELEIEELVKRWIPYVRVIEPVSLREKIEAELKRYLAPKGYDA